MKKLMIISAIAVASMTACAKPAEYTIKYSTVFGGTNNTVMTTDKIVATRMFIPIAKYAEKDATFAKNVDAYLAENNAIVDGILLGNYLFAFPQFAKITFAKTSVKTPVATKLYQKYNTVVFSSIYERATFQEILDLYPEVSDMYAWKTAVSKHGVKAVKKFLRKNGKTFVTQTLTSRDGKQKVKFNPLEIPMKELAQCLNAGRLAGLTTWLYKYGCSEKVNVSFLPTQAVVEALKNSILVDDQTFTQENCIVLEKCLGTEGFNAFVKLYNEGVSK